MFKGLSIRWRVILAISGVVILITSALMYLSVTKAQDIFHMAEKRELHSYYKNALSDLEATGELGVALATVVSLTPEVQEDFAQKNREALAKRTIPLFDVFKKDFATRQFQFHLPPATSFFRAHKPEKFGDDLSSFRKTVLQTNATQQPIMGLEKGVAGIGVRGLVPMFYQGKHTGSVEFGMSFGQAFFERFKQEHGVDLTLYILVKGEVVKFGSTLGDIKVVDESMIRDILHKGKEAQVLERDINGIPNAVYLDTINDFSGNPIGVLEVAMDRTYSVTAIGEFQTDFLLISVVVFILGICASFLISNSITRPINDVSQVMREIAQGDGDLTQRLPVINKDTLGKLAMAFNQFASKVHDTVSRANSGADRFNAISK